MKTAALRPAQEAAAIVRLADVPESAAPAATEGGDAMTALTRARAFAEPLLSLRRMRPHAPHL